MGSGKESQTAWERTEPDEEKIVTKRKTQEFLLQSKKRWKSLCGEASWSAYR